MQTKYVRSMMGLSLISVLNVGTEEPCDFHTYPDLLFGHIGDDVQVLLKASGPIY
jgi:hypothetical protein